MNKHYFILIFFLLIFSINGKGQVLDKFFGIKYHKGYVVLRNGDTLKGEIDFNNDYEDFQLITFRDSLSKKKIGYLPQSVRLVSFDSIFIYPKILRNVWVFEILILNDSLKV